MLVDMTDVADADEIANLIHEAAFRGSFSELATRDAMARAHGRRKLHVLEAALHAHEHGSAGTKSENERALKRLITAAGLPEPNSNVHVEGIEVDLLLARPRPSASRSTAAATGASRRGARTSSSNACSKPSATRSCASPTRRSSDRHRRRSLDSATCL